MPDQPPIIVPPLQLNYQSTPTPDTPPNATLLALDPLALPVFRRKMIALRAAFALLAIPAILIAFILTGLWNTDAVLSLITLAAGAIFAITFSALTTWREITRLWHSFRLTLDDIQITRTAKGRRTATLNFADLKQAQYNFFGGLVLRDTRRQTLIIPRELVGFDLLLSRVQQHLPLRPARISFKLILQLLLPLTFAFLVVLPAVLTWFTANPRTILALAIIGPLATLSLATLLLRSKNITLSHKIRVATICSIMLASHAAHLLLPQVHF